MLRPDQKAGLERLARTVQSVRQVVHVPKEKPEGIANRIEFCRLWIEGDTLESFRRRHPKWSSYAILKRLFVIRRYLGAAACRHQKPYEVAQAYLRLQEGRRFHG